jgi:zinc transporter ZupT
VTSRPPSAAERGDDVPTWLEAALWGLLGGGALVIGALVAWFASVPRAVVATVMSFGSGVTSSESGAGSR